MRTFPSTSSALVAGVVLSSSWACDFGVDREAKLLAAAEAQQKRLEAQREADIAERADAEQALFALISEPGEPLRIEDDAQLRQVVQFYCGECHWEVRSPSFDGWWFESLLDLMNTGKIVPGDAEQSRLIVRLRAGEMPPPSSELPPVPVPVIDAIAELIDSVVPGVGNDSCYFQYLGDSVRCEDADEAGTYRLQGEAALDDCFEACLAQPDCASVTDYSWLGRPDLGCDLYISTCDAPSSGDWQEADAGKEYRKVCTAE